MTTTITWRQEPPASGSLPLKTNPPLQLAPSVHAAEVDARHRAHCRMCTPEPGTAEAFVAALFAAHAPWLTRPAALDSGRPRLAELLTNRVEP